MLERIFKAIEEGFERLRIVVQGAADRAHEVLLRYARRLYRFFRHVFWRLTQIAWLLFKIATFLTAPILVGCICHEIAATASGATLWTVGWILTLIAWIGAGGVLFALLIAVVRSVWPPKAGAPEPTQPFHGRWGPFWLDVLIAVCVVAFATYIRPGYEYRDPILRLIHVTCTILLAEALDRWHAWFPRSS